MNSVHTRRTLATLVCVVAVSSLHAAEASNRGRDAGRAETIRRAQVWTPVDIPSVDIKAGPEGPGSFAFRARVECDYVKKKLDGNTPKFACRIGEDELKVKYGGTNGEVYGEVLGTRLLWALGFGADRMYPVEVLCDDCPREFGGLPIAGTKRIRFDPAVIERHFAGGKALATSEHGWAWDEIESVDPAIGGAPRAHRDALKLLAVFIQHTDSKPQQQRIVCLGEQPEGSATCAQPLLMISDLGMTFGRANLSNENSSGSVNLQNWRKEPVWKDETKCIGNLPKSFSGTLDNPVIGEEGRAFLAGLLMQLSDAQIRDLFEVARVHLRLRSPSQVKSGFPTIDEWVDAFKMKRAQIADRRCA